MTTPSERAKKAVEEVSGCGCEECIQKMEKILLQADKEGFERCRKEAVRICLDGNIKHYGACCGKSISEAIENLDGGGK